MRALIVTAGFLAIAGVALAATPTTIVRSRSPVEAVAQDGGLLAWLSSDGPKCNAVRITGHGKTSVLPQPLTGSMTCYWAMTPGAQQVAVAAGASAALWTLHQRGSDYVMTAKVGGKETKIVQLRHAGDGTGSWLGGITGGGTTLAYSSVDVTYVDPVGCASGGSCKKKIAGGGIELVTAGQKTPLPNSAPALDLAVSDGRIAYIPATAVAQRGGVPGSSSGAVRVEDVPEGTVDSQPKAVGVPLALGLSAHVLAVLSRVASGKMRLTWYDPATGATLGGMGVPATTTLALAVDDQVVVYRVGRVLHGLVVATRHAHVLAKMATGSIGLSLDQARLVWAENRRVRGLSVP